MENNLIKNPLGIIALFISFIYGIAGLVIGINFSSIQGPCERQPLIWFIIVFPIIILGVFVWLVVNHNEKLYSPKDFFNQDGYLIAIGKKILPNLNPETLEKPELIQVSRIDSHNIFKSRRENTRDNICKVFTDTALRQYSIDNNLSVTTEVRVSPNYIADGYATINNNNCLIEVLVDVDKMSKMGLKDHLSRMCNAAISAKIENFVPVMILVIDKKNEKIQKYLSQTLRQIHPNVEIIWYLKSDLSIPNI